MPYEPIRCPTCGSTKTIAAEDKKFYCASCDGWFVWTDATHAKNSDPPQHQSMEAMHLELQELRELVKQKPAGPHTVRQSNPHVANVPPTSTEQEYDGTWLVILGVFLLCVIIALMIVSSSSKVRSKTETNESFSETNESFSKPPSVPEHAFSAGSFSFWTEPAAPQKGENYKIFCQVNLNKLPEIPKNYVGSDLTGFVFGPDSYRDQFEESLSNRHFKVERGAARFLLVERVIGGPRFPTFINIESKLLQEEHQNVRVLFGSR